MAAHTTVLSSSPTVGYAHHRIILDEAGGPCDYEVLEMSPAFARMPDIILMDVQMPELDGLEATRTIRVLEANTGRHAYIVALTAGAFREEQERCLAAGMDDFLTKPIVPEKLKRVLDAVVASKRARPRGDS